MARNQAQDTEQPRPKHTTSAASRAPSLEDGPRRYHEASDLRQLLALPLIGVTLLSLGAALYAYVAWDLWTGKLAAVVALALVAVEFGVWHAHEWSRWAIGILAALLSATIVFAIVYVGVWFSVRDWIFASLLGACAWYALRPGTKEHFARVRAALAQRKLAPAQTTRRTLTPRVRGSSATTRADATNAPAQPPAARSALAPDRTNSAVASPRADGARPRAQR